jgi:hypothetical protein
VSISAFLERKAKIACSLDLAICFLTLGLIFALRIVDFDESMNASIGDESKQNSRSESDN